MQFENDSIRTSLYAHSYLIYFWRLSRYYAILHPIEEPICNLIAAEIYNSTELYEYDWLIQYFP